MQKSKQNRNVEAKNRESNRTVITAINREFDQSLHQQSQHCSSAVSVALKIVVANRLVQHHLKQQRQRLCTCITHFCTFVCHQGGQATTAAEATGTATKQYVKIDKTTTLHVHHASLYIFQPSLHDYNVKVLNFTFCRGRDHKMTTFFFFPEL